MNIEALADAGFRHAAASVAAGRIPGAVLGVVTTAGERAVRVAGSAQIEPEHVPMTRQTWFDLASLTKVIFTTTEILRLVSAGRIALDDPLTVAIPDLRQYDLEAAERKLTFRQCLTHQTHLPAVEPLYTYGQAPETLRAFILQRVWKPSLPVYSDINFMMLGIAIERLTGKLLNDLPLPGGFSFGAPPSLSAATERCTWRGRVMRGEVHDENAFALGGASGHAGLFGTPDGVLDFARSLLAGQLLPAALTTELRKPQGQTRGLGWEIAYSGWPGGDLASPGAIGHTGFTGTGLWIDFDRNFAWTLLTNRVHPSRHIETGIKELRRETGDALARAFAGG